MPVIGLCGGIGAGKSRVASALAAAGCVVSDSDADARAALNDPDVAAALERILGSAVRGGDGKIDRRAVAQRIFADSAARAAVEAVMHPWIERRRRAIFARASAEAVEQKHAQTQSETAHDNTPEGASPRTAALVIDAPLLFEAGLDRACDAIIFVDAPEEVRQQRVRVSRGWNDDELRQREAAQWPLDRKRGGASHVIVNDVDEAELEQRVRAVLRDILRAFYRSA